MTTNQPYNFAASAIERLPKTVSEVLTRGDKGAHRLNATQREAVAEGLLNSGIRKGENLGWMAKLIRHKLGVGDYPTPPSALADELYGYELAERRAKEIIEAVKSEHGDARRPK